jgi:Flp pilus assembly protein TadD
MGQSLMPQVTASAVEQSEDTASTFDAQGFRYRVERRGTRVVHVESQLGRDGQVLANVEAEVEFVLGSGKRGRSYLYQRDGYVFQSPISWYSQKQRWDLAPGYEVVNSHFERPVSARCLFCHSNMVREVEGTTNRFELPIFRGCSVGCERCHGPGELHAREPQLADGVDYRIVNPRHLEPELREAVCEQCHLQGERRVLRANLSTFDYRPGLPLHDFWSVFLLASNLTEAQKAVGQVEQMHSSRCYRESRGELGCISCHDPHRFPAPEEQTQFYRARCQTCHATNGCSLPAADRKRQSPDDSCIQCHMPKRDTDIIHAAMSDHRILRQQDAVTVTEPISPLRRDQRDGSPLVYFRADLIDRNDPRLERDRGIALMGLARGWDDRAARALGRMAVPLLKPAVATSPEDVAAWEALGYAHWLQGQVKEAQQSYGMALQLAPNRENVLVDLGQLNQRIGQRAAAVGYLQRAVAVNPYISSYHAGLAQLYGSLGEWAKSVEACQSALRLNPADWETRMMLVMAYLRTGDRQRAQAEFEEFVQLDPEHEQLLRKLLSDEMKSVGF